MVPESLHGFTPLSSQDRSGGAGVESLQYHITQSFSLFLLPAVKSFVGVTYRRLSTKGLVYYYISEKKWYMIHEQEYRVGNLTPWVHPPTPGFVSTNENLSKQTVRHSKSGPAAAALLIKTHPPSGSRGFSWQLRGGNATVFDRRRWYRRLA